MRATNLNFLNGQKITRPDTPNDDLYHLHHEHLFGKLRENCIMLHIYVMIMAVIVFVN